MFNQVLALCALVVPVVFADPCSIAGTTTIGLDSVTLTPIPCKTFTGNVAVATEAGESFSLRGVEEIQGSLDIIDVSNLLHLDLGDLRKVDRLRIIDSQLNEITYPNLHSVEHLEWDSLYNFMGGNGNPKITNVTRLLLVSTGIEDLSDVFDLESASVIYISDNSYMKNVTLPNLQYIVDELKILENGASVTISFPSLEWARNILIQDVGSTGRWTSGWDGVLGSLDLPKLFEVMGDLIIKYNYKLGSIRAPLLEKVWGDVQVEYNPEIDPMPFEDLHSVGGDLIYTGRFTSLSRKVSSTLGDVRYTTTRDFDCALWAHSTYAYEGGYYCNSATSFVNTRRWRPYYTTPTPTPTPLSSARKGNAKPGLKSWEIGLICLAAGTVGATVIAREMARKKKHLGGLTRRKLNIPVVNAGVGTGVAAKPRPASPPVPVADSDSILPPSVTAMASPPRYSDEFGKTALEAEYRRRL